MNDKYKNHANSIATTGSVKCTVVKASGETAEKETEIIREKFITVTVNGQKAFYLSCTPENLTELVIGRLYTEKIIRNIDEVKELFIYGKGDIAEVILAGKVKFKAFDGVEPTCCTGNKQFLVRESDDSESISNINEDNIESKVIPLSEHIFELAEYFKKDGELHKSTGGTHSCYIRFGNGRILSFEDISRHNALDKAVGAMLLQGEKPQECMIYTTGRVAADMVIKTVAAGVPVLVSKAVPTEEAVKLAEKYGLTMICRAWPDSYEIYS